MSKYIDRNMQAFGRLLGYTDGICSSILTTTDLAEVRRLTERLQRLCKECSEATKLNESDYDI